MKKLLINFFTGFFLFFLPLHAVNYESNFDQPQFTKDIRQVVGDIQNIVAASEDERKIEFERVIKNSTFLKSLRSMQADDLFSFISDLNSKVIVQPDNKIVIDVLTFCVRTLIEEKIWLFAKVFELIEKLYDFNYSKYENESTTSVSIFIDQILGEDLLSAFLYVVLDIKMSIPINVPKEMREIQSKSIAGQSRFYSLLRKAAKGGKLHDPLFSLTTKLNELIIEAPNNAGFVSILEYCITKLITEKKWKSDEAVNFIDQLYDWHSKKYGIDTITPICPFISKILALDPILKKHAKQVVSEIKKLAASSDEKAVERVITKSIFFKSLMKKKPIDLYSFFSDINKPDYQIIVKMLRFCVLTFIQENVWKFSKVFVLIENLYRFNKTEFSGRPSPVLSFIKQMLGEDLRSDLLFVALEIKVLPTDIDKHKHIKFFDDIIKQSKFYLSLKEAQTKEEFSSIFSVITKLNDLVEEPNNDCIIRILVSCFVNLIEEKAWPYKKIVSFLDDLSTWETKGAKAQTPTVLRFINQLSSSVRFLKKQARLVIGELRRDVLLKNKEKADFERIVGNSGFLKSLKQLRPTELFPFISELNNFVVSKPNNTEFIDVLTFCFQILIEEQTWQFVEVFELLKSLFDFNFHHEQYGLMESTSVLSFIHKVTGNSFRGHIVRLLLDLEMLPPTPNTQQAQALIEKSINNSDFYLVLTKAAKDEKLFDSLVSFIKELNTFELHYLKKNEYIFRILVSAFEQLKKQKKWRTDDVLRLLGNLHLWHSKNYADVTTPVSDFIKKMREKLFFSKESRAFMDKMTYRQQFDPIADLIIEKKGDISGAETQKNIIKTGINFFTGIAQISTKMMRSEIYDWFLVNWTPPGKGMSEFRKSTNFDGQISKKALEDSHISLIQKASKEPLVINRNGRDERIKVIKNIVKVLGVDYFVSAAVVEDGEKAIIKSITVSHDPVEDKNNIVFLFVDEVAGVDPRQTPNTQIQLDQRLLYKLQPLKGSYKIRLEQASYEERLVIIGTINKIKNGYEIPVECLIYTAIRQENDLMLVEKFRQKEKELMLVEILRQTAKMMSRALLETITTYVRNYKQPKKGYGSMDDEFDKLKAELEKICRAIYVMVTDEYISQWHTEELMPVITASIENDELMLKLKNDMIAALEPKGGDIWLLRSTMECYFDKSLLKNSNKNCH